MVLKLYDANVIKQFICNIRYTVYVIGIDFIHISEINYALLIVRKYEFYNDYFAFVSKYKNFFIRTITDFD